MTNYFKIWVLPAALSFAIVELLAFISNFSGVSFYKVVVIALLIMVVNNTWTIKSNIQ